MNLEKKRDELKRELQEQRQRFDALGRNIERLKGAIGVLEDLMSEDKVKEKPKEE
jgi:phage shock protein A